MAIFSLQMLLGEEVTINGSGDQERDFVYVEDCAKANLLAMEKGRGEVCNLGTGKETAINHLFKAVKRLADYARHWVHGPSRPGKAFRTCSMSRKPRGNSSGAQM